MKKRIFALIAVIIFITVTALPVYADMGPKESIELTVKNAPDEDYYIDLLMPGSLRDKGDILRAVNEKYSGKDAEMINGIINHYEKGWRPRLGSNIGGRFTHSNSSHSYVFDYDNVPETFKVIIVTESGKVITSDEFTRKSYNAVITYDVEKDKFNEDMSSALIKQLLSIFFTFLATIFIEGIVFLCYKYKFGEGKNFIVFILTNLATQVVLYIASCYFTLAFIAAEVLVTAIEAFVYSHLLTPKEKGGRYALTANVISALLTTPMWVIVKFIFRI